MAGKLLTTCLRQNLQIHRKMHKIHTPVLDKVGNRDIVGFGVNGEASYLDRSDYPMPAIRFKANTPDVLALREKEKGDWKKLSIDEKKALYRVSFRQTLVEAEAPDAEMRGAVGLALFGVTLALWIYMYMKIYVYSPLPDSFSEESQLAQLDRMKKLDVNPINGLCARK